jgi:DNA-binding IscR family transcriptional regulator
MNSVTLDTGSIESTLESGGRVTVKSLAEKHGVSPTTIRDMLNNIYGSRITYIRGRKGGIYLTPASS